MSADVLQKIISANPIKYGGATFMAQPSNGRQVVHYYSGTVDTTNTETKLYNRLNERFDDTNYYSA